MSRWRCDPQMLTCMDSYQLQLAAVRRACISLCTSECFLLCLLSVLVTATSGNGDFGDWSAFNQAPSGPVASGSELFGSAPQPAVELISGSQPALGPPPAASNSSDLFDLMGSSQATMTSSQSMNFSLLSTNTVGLGLPMSRSQVSCLLPVGIVITAAEMMVSVRQQGTLPPIVSCGSKHH